MDVSLKSLIFCFYRHRYPPYSEKKMNFLAFLMRKRKGVSLRYLPHIFMFALGIAVACGVSAIIKVLELTDTYLCDSRSPGFVNFARFVKRVKQIA
jgi:hypothetical protein